MSVRLGEILVKESLITQDQLQKALEFQRANGGKLGNCLTRMGFITDDDITGVLSRQYGVPSINLKDYEIDPNVIKLIPKDTAARYKVLPLSRVGSVLRIAMTDPTNVFAIDDIKFITGFNVEPVLASEATIGDAITRFYGAPSSNMDCQAIRQSDVIEDYLGHRLSEALSDELETHLLGCPDCSALLQYMQSLRDGLEERASSIRTAASREKRAQLAGAPQHEFVGFDRAYVERLRNGDPATEHHFFAYFENFLNLKFRARALPFVRVGDLKRETFIRVITALRRGGEVREPEHFGAFVNSVGNNVLLEYYRTAAKNYALEEWAAEIQDRVLDLEARFVSKQSAERVRKILAALPARDRDLLRAVLLEEKDKDAVCREMGVDRDYLRVLLHRLKGKFKEEWANLAPAWDNLLNED